MPLTIDIISRCNLRCEYCYQRARGVLSLDDVKSFVELYGYKKVEIGGGEPFLHPQLFDILAYLKERDKEINLATNATVIPERFFYVEQEIPYLKDNLVISVHLPAGDRETYKGITKFDLFDKCLQNLQILKAEGFNVIINTPIYRKNFDSLEKIVRIGKELDVPTRFNLVFPVNGRMLELLSMDEIKRTFQQLKTMYERVIVPNLTSGCPLIEKFYNLNRQPTCIADYNGKIYISPDKKTKKCEFL
ncbi:radical SAM protein [Candidatus Woesearchaeota archaeon]|nr:radical SAM protein [Candidatus Woesearchaeota archaeon]